MAVDDNAIESWDWPGGAMMNPKKLNGHKILQQHDSSNHCHALTSHIYSFVDETLGASWYHSHK